MKPTFLATALIILFFSSCTIEDDEFADLTYYSDILIETTVVLEDSLKPYKSNIHYYSTNGFDQLTEKYSSYIGSTNKKSVTFIQPVKGYKKAGVRVNAVENVSYIYIIFYEVGIGKDIDFQYQRPEANKPFTLMYDFETDTHTIIED